ncbi:C-X-C chemokine receptor type 1 [Nibea albiflora]|uniref:C-X-C chemokine receptor type 1 n=1 Tax=Nibea albiflora TaxID=240163 RepID=A0ACB7EJ11_NIBAL|nr:C-X-C chemokine receptor type 1 [Nibea albiflora]
MIFIVLSYSVLTSQEDNENEFTTENYVDLENYTIVYGTDPCRASLPESWTLGLMVTYIVVFVFSMLGNSIVVYVVCYMKKGRATTDIYLMHLAVADLLFSITLPFWAVRRLFRLDLCVDRHFAIVRATRVSSHHLLVKVVCFVVWVTAGLLSLPVTIQKESMLAEDLDQKICYENLTGESSDHWRVGMRVLRHTVGFFLPLVVMAVCYGWTLVTLFHTRNQQKHKAIRVILAVVLAFVVCWLPYNISVLIRYAHTT